MGSPKFTVDWHSHNIPHLRRALDRYKGRPDVRALEIGSFEGRSTVWFLESILTHETARIDCIDTFNGSVEHMRMGLDLTSLLDRFLSNTEPHTKKIRWFRGRSQNILRLDYFGPYEIEAYDFIYIDGSHKAADVLADAVLSFPLLKIGGLMIFDDYAWTEGGPTEFDNPMLGVNSFYYAYQNQLKQVHVNYQAIFERVAESQSQPEKPGAREMVAALAR